MGTTLGCVSRQLQIAAQCARLKRGRYDFGCLNIEMDSLGRKGEARNHAVPDFVKVRTTVAALDAGVNALSLDGHQQT